MKGLVNFCISKSFGALQGKVVQLQYNIYKLSHAALHAFILYLFDKNYQPLYTRDFLSIQFNINQSTTI